MLCPFLLGLRCMFGRFNSIHTNRASALQVFMRLPHVLVHEAHSVLDLFEGFVCVETASLVLDVGGVECHHLERCFAVAESHLVAFVSPYSRICPYKAPNFSLFWVSLLQILGSEQEQLCEDEHLQSDKQRQSATLQHIETTTGSFAEAASPI